MLFKLNFASYKDVVKLERYSALVKFISTDENVKKELELFEDKVSIKLSSLQRKIFLDEKTNSIVLNNSLKEPSVVYLYKVNIKKNFTVDYFRNILAGLTQSLKNSGLSSLNILVPDYHLYDKYFDKEYYYQTFLEGIWLGNYTFDKYLSEKENPKKLIVNLYSSDYIIIKRIIKVTEHIMQSVYFARDLVNEPAVALTPMELAKRTKIELTKRNVNVKIFDKRELQKRKMGAILAVGGSSINQPCLIVMHYKPKRKAKKKIVLVGKGVTYDSGGLSIKPTSGMIEMKADMAGGALVIGIMRAIALANLPIEIVGIVPAVENMLAGGSYKPGDIIKTSSGKTIEVKDTDAEGRIILADALEYASKLKPDQIIDFATLTGACVVALGEIAAGLMTEDDNLAEALLKSSNLTFERIWRLPFWKDYKDMIKSDIADVSNLGPRWGGAITAGKFLEHFVDEKIPWAHLDIAGPAIKHKSTNYTEKYDTGFGIRLMFDYLSKI
ncbi:leucyl aminopeptidase [Melioribacteraceae bacterium 4301-Me]|uniref:leucyl aminopeptidase n=1 Tax=Pyranulibacter aquaticus TaxID=3163344 RepID=UPI003599EC4F